MKSYNVMLNIDINDSIQINFAEIWALKDCNLCASILFVNQKANVPKHTFSFIYSLKKMFGMKNI